jgi:hypothetical protein
MTDRGRYISSKLVYRGKSQLTQAFGIPLQSGFYIPDMEVEIQPCDKTGKRLTGPATMKVLAATIGDPVADAPEKQPEKRYLSVTLIYRMEQPYDGDNPRYGCCIPMVNGVRSSSDMVDIWPCDENGVVHPGFDLLGVPVSASAILEPFRTAPGYGDDEYEWPVCDVCGQPVNPDESHWGHEANCAHELLGICFCKLQYHPACCPDCKKKQDTDKDDESGVQA